METETPDLKQTRKRVHTRKFNVCMVVKDCLVEEHGVKRNIRGKLIYGKDSVWGGQPYIFDSKGNKFIMLYGCTIKDVVSIDHHNLEVSLSVSYRKSRFLGKLNPFLKVPLSKLKKEYAKYEEHFKEWIIGLS